MKDKKSKRKDKSCGKDVLLFDNVDDVIIVNMQGFSRFLSNMLKELDQMEPSCKIRVLITSRQKLSSRETTIEHRIQRRRMKFDGLLEEVELEPLKPEDAQRLFDLCTEKVQVALPLRNRIVDLCGFSPLAIRTIASVIRDGNITAKHVISNLLAAQTGKNVPQISGIYTCLQQTFDSLDISLRQKLIRLSIFQAAPFDIYAAARVLGAYELTQKKPIVIDAQITLLDLKRHHLVEIDKLRSSSDDTEQVVIKPISSSRSLIQYSLHTLVALFLKEQSRQQMFTQEVVESRKRFVSHYKTVVNKCGILEEKNYLKAQRIMEKNRVHLLYFFKLLESSPEAEVELPSYKSSHEDIITSKRIADTVGMMVGDSERLRFLEKANESALRRRDLLCSVLWRTQKGTLLYEMDRQRLAREEISQIETMFDSIEGYEDNAMAAVLGHFYYLKGRFSVEYRHFADGIESLQSAEKFYKSITSERKNYKSYLARVYNAMGNIYYKQQPINLKRAQMFYEKSLELVLSRCDNEYKNLDIPCYLTQVGTCSYRAGIEREEQNEDPMINYNEALKCYNIAISCDLQMKMRECEDFAHKLCRRAGVLARIGKYNNSEEYFNRAERDIRESLQLRRRLLSPPHEAITLTTHVLGDVLRMKALTMHHNKKKAYKVLNVIFEARCYYQETLRLIKGGGLDKDHPEYQKIKENHLWLDRQVDEPEELKKTKTYLQEF
ncbi:hypothetical protein KUTeg_007972 [Tegillarca granosa]|uniref:Uncharacterized protein n=1 Tax=Tegillarca granosa TaxID=220873 RepID=A0ABQ9FIQ8_TEGGR|nr:hypothetical protein KUTeg_007972 [Tegillarca granosa]